MNVKHVVGARIASRKAVKLLDQHVGMGIDVGSAYLGVSGELYKGIAGLMVSAGAKLGENKGALLLATKQVIENHPQEVGEAIMAVRDVGKAVGAAFEAIQKATDACQDDAEVLVGVVKTSIINPLKAEAEKMGEGLESGAEEIIKAAGLGDDD